jgi:phage terminase large subunit-like protein
MVLQPWQVQMMARIMDPDPRPSIVGIMCPRGQGKSQLMAAWALYELFTGIDGNQIVIVASSERQAHLVFSAAALMVQKHPELSSRCQVYRERLEIPAKGSTVAAMPAEGKLLEGLGNFSLAIADEVGVIPRETWQTLLLGLGKVPGATVCGIGTPSASTDSVLLDLRTYARTNPDDPTFAWVEFSADEFAATHGADCRHCWYLANPAMDPAQGEPFLNEAQMTALLPPKTTEGAFRRARLTQFVRENVNPVLPPGLWDSLSTGEPIPDGTPVCLGFDGSYNGDTTALVACTISARPHLDVVQVWCRPPGAGTDWTVPVLEVEQAIRDACRRWRVKECAADPSLWSRSLDVLAAEGWPVSTFPQTVPRMGAATSAFLSAALNHHLTHSGHPTLAEHLAAAVLSSEDRGRLVKADRSRNAGHIDAAVAAVIALSRAQHYAHKPRARYASFKG